MFSYKHFKDEIIIFYVKQGSRRLVKKIKIAGFKKKDSSFYLSCFLVKSIFQDKLVDKLYINAPGFQLVHRKISL